MKKSIALLLVLALILSAALFTACSGSDKGDAGKKEADEKNLSFTTVSKLKESGFEYEFIKAEKALEDDMIVCTVKADASGDLTVPAEYNGKKVIAVLSDSEGCDQVASLTLENGVSFVELCFHNGGAGLAALSLPASVKGVYSSFNSCSALTEVSFPSGVKYIVDSFNSCGALAKIDTNGYIYGIKDSFFADEALADVSFNGSIQKIERSFDGCGATSLTFVENIHDIIASFSTCPLLEALTFEQIAGGVKDSFSDNGSLKSVTYKQGGEQILRSYNRNDVLENVDFGAGVGNISESFEDCPEYSLPEPAAE